jgi:putative oxidoreductase
MITQLFKTSNSITPTILRVMLGFVLLGHGAQKLLGWYGGYGFDGTMGYFTDTVGLPWIIGFMVIVIEFFGAISLILGFATRIWSAAMVILFAGIIVSVHLPNGFFMNWFGNQKGEGFEFFLLAIGMAVSLVISGAGRFSIDSQIPFVSTRAAQPNRVTLPQPVSR